MSEHIEQDDEIIECWCGAKGTYDELFADDFPGGCGGSGYLDCECGGDNLCVCHNHGQVECPGCDECEYDDEEDWWYGDDEEDYWNGIVG